MMSDRKDDRARRGLAGRMVDAVVAPIVSPIVSAVDVPDVVDRIDVEELLERVDIDRLVARIDMDAVLERVDINQVLARVDPNALLDRVDPNALLDRVDPNALLDRVDPNALLDRVDPNALLDRVDPDRLLDRVDPDRLLDRVDPNALLDRVDPNLLLDRVDPDRLIGRVDANALIDRVDPNLLLDRVDVDRLVARIDVDALMARVDVNDLVKRTELGEVIARSTTGIFGQLLDIARAIGTSVDLVVQGAVGKVVRRGKEQRPGRPEAPDDVVDAGALSMSERGVALQGHYAGSVSRFLAFMIDQFLIGLFFLWGRSLVSAAFEVVTGETWNVDAHRWLAAVTYTIWAFLYLAVPLAVSGRTVGKAVLGLQVVRSHGSRLDWRHAALRTAVFPLSFLLFGLGLLMGLVRRDRRELHDLIADTAVIYAWDAELARLRAG